MNMQLLWAKPLTTRKLCPTYYCYYYYYYYYHYHYC